MIKSLDDLPEGVIGFETSGPARGPGDYRDVLIPAIEQAAVERGPVRVVVVIDHFRRACPGALCGRT